jgi:hypothetical protein
VVIEFADERRAVAFERYLKSGSGVSFAQRHLARVTHLMKQLDGWRPRFCKRNSRFAVPVPENVIAFMREDAKALGLRGTVG